MLGFLDRKDWNRVEVLVFTRMKQEGFGFLMELLETGGANPRQLHNALLIAVRIRGWDLDRFNRTLLALRDSEDIVVRARVWHLLTFRDGKTPLLEDLPLLKRREDALLDAIQAHRKGRELETPCPYCEGRLEVRATVLERPFTRFDVTCPCGRCTCSLRGMAPGVLGNGQ
ncbi:hypothetical protein D7W81_31460 [Corallococcus aberystwythensis]|uniref:Uncharacterized protein n=1 Tax=Corallococcus aberystwythensis TaxID=2316722 RepID=A0A3A8PLT3_9BACT|nr:hypothetical protein D7W81_31460 [Corallococcus aberystwythensis]